MSFRAARPLQLIVVVSLCLNLIPVPPVVRAAPRQSALAATVLPAWFRAEANASLPAPAARRPQVWLPVVGPVDSEPAAIASAPPLAPLADDPPPTPDTGRGYYPDGLTAEFYDGVHFSGALVATVFYTQPIDFFLDCGTGGGYPPPGQPYPYSACELHPALTDGQDYSVRWYGQ